MIARVSLVALACVLVADAGAAQTPVPSGALSQTPLPSASLPARTPAALVPPARGDVFLAPPGTYDPTFDRQLVPDPRFFPGGYGYGYPVAPSPGWHRSGRRETRELGGFLQLDVQPGTAQVYVDGYYVGRVDDIRRSIPGRPLEAGSHRVELRAPGYEPTSVDMRLAPNELLTYEIALTPTGAAAPSAPLVPATPKTFYVIPGCYAGDKPPAAAWLPANCDVSKVQRVPPVVQRLSVSR